MYAYVWAQSIALCLSIKNEKTKHKMKSHSLKNSNAIHEQSLISSLSVHILQQQIETLTHTHSRIDWIEIW